MNLALRAAKCFYYPKYLSSEDSGRLKYGWHPFGKIVLSLRLLQNLPNSKLKKVKLFPKRFSVDKLIFQSFTGINTGHS